jgi:hypothetical protein
VAGGRGISLPGVHGFLREPYRCVGGGGPGAAAGLEDLAVWVFHGGVVLEIAVRKSHSILLTCWLTLVCCVSACDDQGPLDLVSYSRNAGVGYDVCLAKDHAYVTNNSGVVIFDVREPKRPRKVGNLSAGVTFGIWVENGLAYISGEHGLVTADVSDPTSPRKLAEYAIGRETHRVRVEGSYVYVASSEGLEILDVRDPGRVTPTAHFGDGMAWGVEVCGGIAYLADYSNGVEVIDVTDPASPRKIKTLAGTKGASDVHVHDEYLYVGCHGAGIGIFNISDRKSPQRVGSFRDDDNGEALGVWGDGRRLYVADNFGIEVLDVTDPTDPYQIGEYSRVKGAHDLCVDGSFIYIADASRGLVVLRFEENWER